MRTFYFLSNLCKTILGSRGNEPGYDCRFTVGSPSGHHSSALLQLVSVFAVLLTLGVGNVWGATDTYDFNTNGITKSSGPASGDQTSSSSNVVFTSKTGNTTDSWTIEFTGNTYYGYGKNNGVHFGKAAGAPHARLTSKSYPNVTGVEINSTQGNASVTISVSVGGTSFGSLTSGTNTSHSFTHSAATGAVSISVESNTNGRFQINSIVITYSSCDKSVTISKGTSTNCTFSLSKSGSQASCDGVSTTVTVSPTSGYGSPSVTESGASAAPTITGSSNTYTVAYAANTTGTSTINVSCSANNYTINLNTDLTPTSAGTTSITATYNASTNLTSAITKPTKTGWTFGGYYTARNGGGTQIIGADGNVIASVSGYTDASKNWKYVGNITLYAKWTCTVTWSVNGSTSVYSTQTVTYNSSGSKVASIPGPPSPASYCGDKFMGWSAKSAGSESKTTSYYDDLFTTVAGSPDIKNIGNTTFYAVFADYDE